MKNNGYWLISTAHLEEGLWFYDDEDFKVGMNYVALQVAACPGVSVLSFILMSNHVHFVLCGGLEAVSLFINEYKRRYSIYMKHKHGLREYLRRNEIDVRPVQLSNESLERAIAYVQVNCVYAGICAHPSQYRWGTGNEFFNPIRPAGTPIGTLSDRARIRLLHSNNADIPKEWIISDDGVVLPGSYVCVRFVESLYRTPNRYNFFLRNSFKAKKRMESSEEHLPAFRDQSIISVLPDLCRSLFGKDSYDKLTEEEQVELLRQIKYRFSSNVNQIARVCGLSYEEAAKKLDSI